MAGPLRRGQNLAPGRRPLALIPAAATVDLTPGKSESALFWLFSVSVSVCADPGDGEERLDFLSAFYGCDSIQR